MINWMGPMQQTFEFYIVDPNTWTDIERVTTITKGSILRDAGAETLGSASFDITEEIGECYIRTYLFVTQGRETGRYPLGVHLVQTPEIGYDGRATSVSLDAYTPLLELKENSPPYGYTILADTNVMDIAYSLTNSISRAPVVKATSSIELGNTFVAEMKESYLEFISALIANADMIFDIDEMGRIMFAPKIEVKAMQPVFTFNDNNSSILYPSVSVSRDLYGIPNVVEAVYSDDNVTFFSRIENNDPDSPTSIQNRGRVVLYRDSNPDLPGFPTQAALDSYARQILEEMSSLEYTVTYTHGYLPTVRVGDCVRLNYERAGIVDVRAKVIKQSITLEPGCPVEETAVYTMPVINKKFKRLK